MMGRKPKDEIIAELRAKGIEFDENASWNDLWKLLKDATVPDGTSMIHLEGDANGIDITKSLYERAKKIGMSPEMIAGYPDEASLKLACDKISPQTNPDYRPQQADVPQPVPVPEAMPDKFEFESRLEQTFMMPNRVQFDEANLQSELRKINRRYGLQKPVKIVKTVTFEGIKGITKDKVAAKFLVTKFEIFMKG